MNICRGFFEYPSGRRVPCKETLYLDASGFCQSHCPVGEAEWADMKAMFEENKLSTKAMMSILYKKYGKHYEQFHGKPPPKETHTGNGTYQGAFAFTLTKSPDDDLTEEDMIKAVRKVMNQKSCPVKKFAWYLEYGDEGLKLHPHIHGLYETETGGMIETKHWKRAWPIWNPKQKLGNGFRGGYMRPVRDNECYDDYIKKQQHQGERFNC